MRRTLLVAVVPAGVVAALWLRLEQPRGHAGPAAAIVALALAPAVVRPLAARGSRRRRGVPGRRSGRFRPLAAASGRAVVTGFGSRFSNGFRDFYGVKLPFDPRVHADMRGVVLAAVFGFVLVVGLAVAARRAVAATLVLLVGAGWPATLAGSQSAPAKGVAILLAVLIVLAGLTARRVPRAAVPAAAALVLVALAASTPSAVAKGELVGWQRWDFVKAPQAPVSVSYVWDAQYGGLVFPRLRTTVLEIKAPRGRRCYWRSAVLDVFAGDRWLQGPPQTGDALEPAAARDRTHWVREQVTVKALADTHLVGGSIPVAFAAGDAPLQRPEPGVALLPSGLTRGFQYTAWSYAPRPQPAQLARSRPVVPEGARAAGRVPRRLAGRDDAGVRDAGPPARRRRGARRASRHRPLRATRARRRRGGGRCARPVRRRARARSVVQGRRRLHATRPIRPSSPMRRSSASSRRRGPGTASTSPARWR